MDNEPATSTAPTDLTLPYPASLYVHVGAVAVMGACVEGALIRLLRRLDPARMGQPYDAVTWDALERQIRKDLESTADPAVAALVNETLSWASERDLRVKRNKVIHDEWPLTVDDGIWVTRFNKRSAGLTVVGSEEQAFEVLAETAEQLLELASRLNAITRSLARSRVAPAATEPPT